jgi:D-glycero-alpha-D-manno-heptose 1-phosphate guanylyltransferase
MKTNQPSEMLILAGGFGTRLKSVVSDVPKPMAPIAGRPFLAYLLDYWIGQGIQRFVLSTGYLGNIIRAYFSEIYHGAVIDYVHEKSPLGTGGALRLTLNSVSWTKETALMANGDTWFPVDLKQLCGDAEHQNLPITLALKTIGKNDRYGGVDIGSDGKVKRFGVKSKGQTHINGGCYLFNVGTLKQALTKMPETFSLEGDFLPLYAANGLVGSSLQDQPFLDIGIPKDYQKASTFLK